MSDPKTKGNPSFAPALLLSLDKEITELLAESPWHKTTRAARTLAKYSDFRIVLTALKQGEALQEHQAKGCLSIQALEGRIRVRLPGQVYELSDGDLLALDNAIPHAVEAIENSIFLITMSFSGETQ